jgi:predicted nucleic-acid-binding protein
MIAIDTNLIIRYLTGDNTEQTERARDVINSKAVFVTVTVALETEWVLRGIYRVPRLEREKMIRGFAGLPTVFFEDATAIAEALDLLVQGMDFADALHLLRARHCETLVTFDRKFIKAAHAAGHPIVKEA